MNVYDNVAFGLSIKKMNKQLIKEKVLHMLKLVGLEGYENRNVNQLSGGQQQRVAIARALVNEPKVLLLDEPLGALDAKLRKDMQFELKKIQKEVGITFIFVTHDQEEALSMSDTVVVMNHGNIQQIGSPIDIYNEPKNRFVADFIGDSNIIPGVMKQDFLVSFDQVDFPCVDKGFLPNEEIEVVLRPEDLILSAPKDGQLTAAVTNITFMGVHYEIILEGEYRTYKAQTTQYYEVGTKLGISVLPDNIHVMQKMKEESYETL
jgi:spermidine/putrescine transport system ATP-binding protein